MDAKERARRLKISQSAKASPKQKAHHDKLRGVRKGPESIQVRAKKSASKKALPGTKAWDMFYAQALRELRLKQKHDEERRALGVA